MQVEKLSRDTLRLGGFAGLKEHRLVVDPKVGWSAPGAWAGMGNFVYLADARFNPHGETRLHPHRELDVISVMVDGRIDHEGTMGHGQVVHADQVQVQRAGGEGFYHNEINPDDETNRMIQLWVLPETYGEPAGYKIYNLETGALKRIYGGDKKQTTTFDNHTHMEVGLLTEGQSVSRDGAFMAYITRGGGTINGMPAQDGDLLRGTDFQFVANAATQMIVVTQQAA